MPALAELLPMLAFLLVIGGAAGVIAGLLGVGGGIVLVPAFLFAFSHLGYDGPGLMQVCLGTSLATIVFSSLRSVRLHDARGAVDRGLLRQISPAVVLGAVLGTATAMELRTETLQAVFGVLAMIAGLYLAFGRAQWRLAAAMPSGARLYGYGGALGYVAVLMGIGGGTFGVPLMTLHGMAIHRAIGTAAGLGLVIAVPAVAGFLFVSVAQPPPMTVGAVNIPAFLAVIGTTMITTPWGARLAHRMDAGRLKRIFAVFILIVAVNMLRKSMGW
ncbi:MAG: sulfite exporter TauE/SafE family protein [Paracoccaceae bacterium]|nr:MAG: sulfite exporter TauE/SafE family protein [Paracoccaceae bacterium]